MPVSPQTGVCQPLYSFVTALGLVLPQPSQLDPSVVANVTMIAVVIEGSSSLDEDCP